MKKILSNVWQVYLYAVSFWVIMFLVSVPLVDPKTGNPWMNLYIFHGIVFVASIIVAYFFFRYFFKKGWISNSTFYTFFIVNVLLDFVLLIPFFGVTIIEWVTLILPSYILGTALMYKLFKKQS